MPPKLTPPFRLLIVGEVGVGKTLMTAHILEELAPMFKRILIIDMAPNLKGVGVPLANYLALPENSTYLRPDGLRAPRLEGRNANEVLELAKVNASLIRPLLIRCWAEKPDLLVINDLSIYLQAGDLEDLVRCIYSSDSFLGNSYYGKRLVDDKGAGISLKEREGVEALMDHLDYIVHLLPDD